MRRFRFLLAHVSLLTLTAGVTPLRRKDGAWFKWKSVQRHTTAIGQPAMLKMLTRKDSP